MTNTNPTFSWNTTPSVITGTSALPAPGFMDRNMKLALLCHDCNIEYPDHRRLGARDVGGFVVLSCSCCDRDLAIVDAVPPEPGEPDG